MKLSPKELECYNHAIKLMTNKEIAIAMNISEKGVKHHLTNIFKKTKTTNKIHLFATLSENQPSKDNGLSVGLANSLDLHNNG